MSQEGRLEFEIARLTTELREWKDRVKAVVEDRERVQCEVVRRDKIIEQQQCEVEGLKDRIDEHHKMFERMRDENEKLRAGIVDMIVRLRFARSVIKSNEPWTDKCEEVIGGVLEGK